MSTNGIEVGNVRGNAMVVQAGGDIHGDIVAGNKTVIQNIIQQAVKQIVAAPYKFLASYDICDRDIFFGRDAVIEELISNFPRYKTLVINGRSGSGKTSLINAGLIPRLAENGYHYLSFRDYRDPLDQLREHVKHSDIFHQFFDHTGSFTEFLKIVTQQHRMHLVVIFDQFERFFVNVPLPVRAQFIQEIKTCLDSDLSGEELDLVFALREDFYGRFASDFETTIPTFRRETDLFHLRPLTRAEAREAIINPLRKISHKIGYHKEFVDDVLLPGLMGESAGGAQIDPPHLQIVCNQLYQAVLQRHAAELDAGDVIQIDRQLYESLGETKGILRTYLDEFIDRTAQQDAEGRNVLHSMLKLMVATTGTRKFVSLPELQRGLPDVAPEKAAGYLQTLQAERIIETRRQDDATRYSLSHEVMVAKVQSWFDEREMERKRAQETLERGLAEWKNTQALLNANQVGKIRQWLAGEALGTDAEQLLTQSQQAYEERQRQEAEQERRIRLGKRIVRSVIGVALVVAIGLAAWALWERSAAQQKQRRAERQAWLSLTIFEQRQAQAFVEMLQQLGIREFGDVPDTLVQKEEQLADQRTQTHDQIVTERSKPITEQNFKAIDTLEQRQALLFANQTSLRNTIRQTAPQYFQLTYPQRVAVSDQQNTVLLPGEVVLIYDVTKSQTTLWIVSKDDFDFVPLNFTETDLQQEVAVFRAIHQGIIGAYQTNNFVLNVIDDTVYETAKIGYALYQRLFPMRLIRRFLAQAQTVYIVPTGPLADVPFEALVTEAPQKDGTPPHYLFQEYAIAYLSSSALLKSVRENRAQRQRPDRAPFFAVANPAVSGSQFAPRPDNEDMVRKVAQTLNVPADSDALYFGENASRRNLLRLNEQRRLNAYRYLLFSTYGILPGQIDTVTQPALVLAHPEKEEGYLTMADVFGLHLNADLVVLAAGDTAGNSQQEYMGLPRAWMYAGTSAVIATLWKIDSKLAHELVTRLFQRIQEGQAPAAALRLAKLDVLKKAQEDEDVAYWRHPFFWSPFVLFGDGSGSQTAAK